MSLQHDTGCLLYAFANYSPCAKRMHIDNTRSSSHFKGYQALDSQETTSDVKC